MDRDTDLLVYGATPGGIATAVRAGREGLDVTLVTIRTRVGGMMAGGLSWTDSTVDGPRTPLLSAFTGRVREHYESTYGADSEQYENCGDGWLFEPHVAEAVFEDLLAEAGVDVAFTYAPRTVERDGRRIEAVTFERITAGGPDAHRERKTRETETDAAGTLAVTADAFADATYEGDLYAAAGCAYRVGRESREAFGEQYAGRLYSEKGTRLFPGSTGAGDDAVQSYDYRLCLTKDASNRRPVPKPDGYDREEFLPVVEDPPELHDAPPDGNGIPAARESEPMPCHLKSELVVQTVSEMREKGLEALMLRGPLPNEKRDLNTADLPGAADDYPEADWERRREIERRHRDHVLGLLYFVQNDEAVPEDLRELFGRWGLPRDEFEEADGVPFQIYVREARRLAGRETFTEHDAREAEGLGRAPVHADAIAITEYPMDSHDCRPLRRPGSLAEGHFFLPEITVPGQVPYSCLLPREVDNLLVPVACSATHVGYGTIRLEPTWLQIGEAAGFAAALAADRGVPPADLDVYALQSTLAEAGSRLTHFGDAEPGPDHQDAAVQFCGTKGFFGDYDARADDPLDADTAAVWAETAAGALEGGVDATARARALPGDRSGEITPRRFADLLERACECRGVQVDVATARDTVDPDEPLSRGDACRMVYELAVGDATVDSRDRA
ncbi:MAG: FAD-dependent oxidoreductase [Halobacteriales archaeon]